MPSLDTLILVLLLILQDCEEWYVKPIWQTTMIICYWQLSKGKVLVVLVDEPSSYLPAKCITVCIRNTYIYVIYTYSEVYASDEWWSSERSFELSLTKYEI